MNFLKYPKIKNLYNIDLGTGIFNCEFVSITEKIHGTNARVFVSKQEVLVGSRNQTLTKDNPGIKGQFEYCYELGEKLRLLLLEQTTLLNHSNVVLFGEWAGPGIQKEIKYGDEKHFYCFDICLEYLEDNSTSWLTVKELEQFCNLWGIKTVPILALGVKPDLELFNSLYEIKSKLSDSTLEGIVIKSSPVEFDQYDEIVYAKHKNDKWSETATVSKQPKVNVYSYCIKFITRARVLHAVDIIKEDGRYGREMSDMRYLPTIITDDIVEEENIIVNSDKDYKKLRGALSKHIAKIYKEILIQR